MYMYCEDCQQRCKVENYAVDRDLETNELIYEDRSKCCQAEIYPGPPSLKDIADMVPDQIVDRLQEDCDWAQELPALVPVALNTSETADPSERLRALSRIGLLVARQIAK